VVNASGAQVGHVPAAVAAKMAWMLDAKLISASGYMVAQNLDGAKHYKLAMDVSIYARPSLREGLEPELVWATPGQQGFEAMRRGITQEPKPIKGKGRAGATNIAGSSGSGAKICRIFWMASRRLERMRNKRIPSW
jgi:SWI/SNF-related matrix-associated actin-dependent regulator of chromatin subfamily A3